MTSNDKARPIHVESPLTMTVRTSEFQRVEQLETEMKCLKHDIERALKSITAAENEVERLRRSVHRANYLLLQAYGTLGFDALGIRDLRWDGWVRDWFYQNRNVLKSKKNKS